MKTLYNKMLGLERTLEELRNDFSRDEEQLLDQEEAMRLLNLDARVFQALVRSGELPCVELSQKTKRFRRRALLQWAENREIGRAL